MAYVPVEGLRYEFTDDRLDTTTLLADVTERLDELGMQRVEAEWELTERDDPDQPDLHPLVISGYSDGSRQRPSVEALNEALNAITGHLAERNPSYHEWLAFQLTITVWDDPLVL